MQTFNNSMLRSYSCLPHSMRNVCMIFGTGFGRSSLLLTASRASAHKYSCSCTKLSTSKKSHAFVDVSMLQISIGNSPKLPENVGNFRYRNCRVNKTLLCGSSDLDFLRNSPKFLLRCFLLPLQITPFLPLLRQICNFPSF